MELDVIRMVLPVLVMIGIGYFCNRKQIFDMNGLKGLKALLGDIMLPVMLFNAFFTAAYSVRVVVVFLVVFIGYGIAIALGYVLRPAVKPYGKYLPFLLASAEGGMLGYALYGLISGGQFRICSGGSGTDRIRLHGLAWMPDFCRWRKSRCKSIVEKYVFQ